MPTNNNPDAQRPVHPEKCCDGCRHCPAYENNGRPLVFLGCCVHWDSECVNGAWQEPVNGVADVLDEFDVIWYHECNGHQERTLICFDSFCQFKNAKQYIKQSQGTNIPEQP